MPRTKSTEEQERYLTPPEIAARLRITPVKVIGWIRKAELRAVDVGNGTRPRYRISPDDLKDFLRRREVPAPAPRIQRREPKQPEGGPLDPELGKKLTKEGKACLSGKKYYRIWNGIVLYF